MGPNEFFCFKSNKQVKLLQSVLSIDVVYSDLDWLDINEETTDNNLLRESEVEPTNTYQYL
ncbi:MAG: hypothetical protein QMB03_11610 [Spirosomataceae bacterium]